MTDVSLSHRDVNRATAPDVERAGDQAGDSPPAQRLQLHRWRDPRLWLGIALVLVSLVVGAALFSSADHTVSVWAADADLRAGSPITGDDVHSAQVHFADSSAAAAYLPAAEPVPDGAVLARDVSAGELLATAAVSDAAATPDRLPLAVSAAGMPAGLAVGDTVDVWAAPSTDSTGTDRRTATRALDDVTVTSLGAVAEAGLDTRREVLVALPTDAEVGQVLDLLSGSDVVLVLVGE